MNVTDPRNVDFDAYRQQALELRRQAMDEAIDRAVARVRSLFGPRRSAPRVAASGAPCPA